MLKIRNQDMHPLHAVSAEDAIGMLIADHKRVASLFADFKRLTDEGRDKETAALVAQICQELSVHTQLEEELFYPAVRKAINDELQMDEALVEHAGATQLISQLQGADPGDALYAAKVTVLAEQIGHHVEEEEGSMFPKARYAGVDTRTLGAAMLARKSELLGGVTRRAPPTARPGGRRLAADDDGDDIDKASHRPRAKSKKPAKKKSSAKKKRR
jgi:hemerythrin superfamily protein